MIQNYNKNTIKQLQNDVIQTECMDFRIKELRDGSHIEIRIEIHTQISIYFSLSCLSRGKKITF